MDCIAANQLLYK